MVSGKWHCVLKRAITEDKLSAWDSGLITEDIRNYMSQFPHLLIGLVIVPTSWVIVMIEYM